MFVLRTSFVTFGVSHGHASTGGEPAVLLRDVRARGTGGSHLENTVPVPVCRPASIMPCDIPHLLRYSTLLRPQDTILTSMSSQALLHHAPLAAPVSGGRSHSACARRSARLQPLPRRSSHRLRTAAAATPKSSNGAVPPKAPEAGAWDKDTHIIPPTAAKSGKADTSSGEPYSAVRFLAPTPLVMHGAAPW